MKPILSTLVLSSLLFFVSCGNNGFVDCLNGCKGNSGGGKPPVVVEQPASILNDWQPTSTVVVIEKLSLSDLELNIENDADLVFVCDGTFGNSGLVNGVSEGSVLITGDEQSGLIQFGHTKYVGASDPECRNVSKEGYTYEVQDKMLTLCMVNYDFCTTYEKI